MSLLSDIVNVLRFVIAYVPRSFWKALVQPVLNTAVFLIVVFGFLSYKYGGPAAALSAVFVLEHSPDRMQAELKRAARRDILINDILTDILKQSPTAARVRLGVLHNGAVGLNGVSLFRYDITNSRAREGYAPGPITSNSPLATWSYVNAMLANECVADGPDKWTPQEKMVLAEMGVGFRLICPVIDQQAHLQGALYMTWSNGPHDPPERIKVLSDYMRDRGRAIALVIAASTDN